MDVVPLEPARRAALRPWLIILLTGPLLTAGLGLVAYRWQSQRQDFARLADQFVQRQNRVLAHDAIQVSRTFASLLAQGARDARALSSLPVDAVQYEKFFTALRGPGAFPVYNRMAVLRHGDLWWFEGGKPGVSRMALSKCEPVKLCDRRTLEQAQSLADGKAMVGTGLRWYTPEGSDPALPDEGTLSVAYRTVTGIYLLGIDFKSFLPIVRLPTFPYQERGDLMQDYEDGSYIYLLDAQANLLAHPRRWHVMGVDRATGLAVEPMRNDDDAGKRPLNFRAYREGRLRPYFDRLLAHAFQGSEVDVFQAANFSGLVRVISVAPVTLDASLFEQKGPFGYVGVGCAVEHFHEPEERLVPYY